MFYLLFVTTIILASPTARANDDISIGSKKFTESVILGEIVSEWTKSQGIVVNHRKELGGSRVLWNALIYGDIQFYPEYTGTIRQELLAGEHVESEAELDAELTKRGVARLKSFGFEDKYALGVRRAIANQYHLKTISDLKTTKGLRFGFSSEFAQRKDGWVGLKDAYQLPEVAIRRMDHEIAYRALAAAEVDVIDLYSTDAEIQYYDIAVLEDDHHFFPPYEAILLYRKELLQKQPKLMAALAKLQGRIPPKRMIELNAKAKLDRETESQIARDFLKKEFGINPQNADSSEGSLIRFLVEHVSLVLKSMGLAILVALPLGILASRRRRLGQVILAIVGLIQTIPALALLVLMIQPLKLLGLSAIGETPAIIALFLYSLLPMVRNTHTALTGIPIGVRESANVLGLSSFTRLLRIYLPIASPTILAGIKTAAVINVGFATLGALIGAGGLGQPILTGIRLDDPKMISSAAGMAAALALVVQYGFEYIERWLIPRGLRS